MACIVEKISGEFTEQVQIFSLEGYIVGWYKNKSYPAVISLPVGINQISRLNKILSIIVLIIIVRLTRTVPVRFRVNKIPIFQIVHFCNPVTLKTKTLQIDPSPLVASGKYRGLIAIIFIVVSRVKR